jgi:hypothetical protein
MQTQLKPKTKGQAAIRATRKPKAEPQISDMEGQRPEPKAQILPVRQGAGGGRASRAGAAHGSDADRQRRPAASLAPNAARAPSGRLHAHADRGSGCQACEACQAPAGQGQRALCGSWS